jgi:hypothetical protein
MGRLKSDLKEAKDSETERGKQQANKGSENK